MGATRLASGIKAKAHTLNKGSQTALITRLFVSLCLKNPDAGRVAPISGSVWDMCLVVAGPLPYYNNLHAEHLTSYTNMLQLIGYQYFTQCKILQIPPTHNLHNPHAATLHKHGRVIYRHRGAKKSVAPTDCSTSLWRKIHRIHPNRLRGSGVGSVRCMEESVRYFELILHSWIFWISACYALKV